MCLITYVEDVQRGQRQLGAEILLMLNENVASNSFKLL